MKNFSRGMALGCIVTLASPALIAAEGAHEHGFADATLAGADGLLELQLDVPGDSVFGFEHQPETDEQRDAVIAAMAQLRDTAGDLVVLSGGECVLVAADARTPLEHDEHDHEEHGDHDDHDHDDHDHEGHDHEEHEHEEHEHEEHEHEEHADHDHEGHEHHHSEVAWTLNWKCDDVADVDALSMNGLLNAFPRLQTVRLQWAMPQGQGAARLSLSQPEAELAP
ncbi:DUF2796 domain-containing protein [Granulosicoccaceae sp. 1_MG-2023]|nr:DUF2796 domain-containing protein [Granulosicoccaceae sp. 1_MG-2023]